MSRTILVIALALAIFSPSANAIGHTSHRPTPTRHPIIGDGGLSRGEGAGGEVRAVAALFRRLTQHEKLTMLTGTGFTTQPIPRLGIPALAMADGPRGVRGGQDGTFGNATQFLEPIAMAATWNPEVINTVGKALGEETLNKGTGARVILGPCVNIERSPLGGRDGESFGEDPYLAGQIAVGYIRGVQSTGASACIKHFACNNEEIDRDYVNALVDERALREIYLPAFQAGIQQGNAWTLMASYNKINGYHATANHYLMTEILRNEWGFQGIAMSDWGAVHETDGVVNAGLDLEMPGGEHLTESKLADALRNGHITQAQIDIAVKHILWSIVRCGLMNGPHKPNHANIDSQPHRDANFNAALEAMVLLKNDGAALPLNRKHIGSLAVIGPLADVDNPGIGGSSSVSASHFVKPLTGIKQAAPNVDIRYAPGCGITGGATRLPNIIPASVLTPTGAMPTALGRHVATSDDTTHGLTGDYFANAELKGRPVVTRIDPAVDFDWAKTKPAPGLPQEHFSVRWSGTLTAPKTGTYELGVNVDDGVRVYIDGQLIVDHWTEGNAAPTQTGTVDLVAGHSYKIRVDYYQAAGDASIRLAWLLPGETAPGIDDAVAAASHADAAVVFVGTAGFIEGEGFDRHSTDLPGHQADLIRAVAAVNKRTIVVISSGGPITMGEWIGDVPGVIQSWNAGQETGRAIAGILFGDIDPSGKLPMTIGKRREDYADYGNFPGKNGRVKYAEGIFVGYRHFDHARVEPQFPFGYGLSYTTFRYHDLKLSPPSVASAGNLTATLSVTNTGHRFGKEVVELYTHDPNPRVAKALRELKGFQKIALNPGQTKSVTFTLTPKDLAYVDPAHKCWRADPGTYEVQIGSSSRDIRLTGLITMAKSYVLTIPGMGNGAAGLDEGYAAGRPATASSTQEKLAPANAVDGDPSTRWGSEFSDPQWLAVDLGQTRTIRRVKLQWEDAYASAYDVQVSLDGKDWTTVCSKNNGHGYIEELRFAPVKARHVRIYCRRRGTVWGDSIISFGVFGK